MQDLTVTGACGSSALLRHLGPSLHGSTTTIDLRAMTFCQPLGLVAIAAHAERAIAVGRDVTVLEPAEPQVARYLSRMRLGRVLDGLAIAHTLPVVRESHLPDALVEIERFDRITTVEQLAKMVHAEAEKVDAQAASALHVGICEVGDNVLQHAQRGHGYVAAQRFPKRRELQFAVSDSGVGLLATLRERGPTDDRGALAAAVTSGVSAKADPRAGGGLVDVVREVSALGGALHLVSGDSSLTAQGSTQAFDRGGGRFRGTAVQGSVRW